MSKKRITILDVPFDSVSLNETVEQIEKWLNRKEQFHIATPNPEILLAAQNDPAFLTILQNTELNIPDGAGIIWADQFLQSKKSLIPSLLKYIFKKNSNNSRIKKRVTGSDLLNTLLEQRKKDQTSSVKAFLLGAAPGIAKKLHEQNPKKVVGSFSGSHAQSEEEKIIKMINQSDANILFVAFGAPTQEKWIARNLKKMPKVKVAIGVGGAFDFLAGKKKRAPKIMRKLGVEWLFRLLQEPSRIKRIVNATILFPIKVNQSRKRNS